MIAAAPSTATMIGMVGTLPVRRSPVGRRRRGREGVAYPAVSALLGPRPDAVRADDGARAATGKLRRLLVGTGRNGTHAREVPSLSAGGAVSAAGWCRAVVDGARALIVGKLDAVPEAAGGRALRIVVCEARITALPAR